MKTRVYIAAALMAILCLTTIRALAQTKPSTKERTMTARGTFEVKLVPQDDKLNDGISRMVLDKQYHGDLEGSSKGQMLATGSAKSSGAYVAMETFSGTLQGKTGGFSLYHRASWPKARQV
jgi:Protein of unknown function (DUF3224)